MRTSARAAIRLLALLVPAGVHAAAGGADWMGRLDGGLRLSELSLPGTHNSGALHEDWPGTAACQTASIAEQLAFGVRVLDIRCRHVNDAFAIHHGAVDQKLSFGGVLEQVNGFLERHPTECVIMSVKEEHTAGGVTRGFEATFDAYVAHDPGRWWLGAAVPALERARGRIVLLRRFAAAATPKGIDASRWPDNAVFEAGRLKVQDCYKVTDRAAKWAHVSAALEAARAATDAGVLHLNFASGHESRLLGIPSIGSVAGHINPRLAALFGAAAPGHYGCVLMDFADARLARLIWSANRPADPACARPPGGATIGPDSGTKTSR